MYRVSSPFLHERSRGLSTWKNFLCHAFCIQEKNTFLLERGLQKGHFCSFAERDTLRSRIIGALNKCWGREIFPTKINGEDLRVGV